MDLPSTHLIYSPRLVRWSISWREAAHVAGSDYPSLRTSGGKLRLRFTEIDKIWTRIVKMDRFFRSPLLAGAEIITFRNFAAFAANARLNTILVGTDVELWALLRKSLIFFFITLGLELSDTRVKTYDTRCLGAEVACEAQGCAFRWTISRSHWLLLRKCRTQLREGLTRGQA